MKLKVLKTYQSVRFGKNDETYFNPDKPGMSKIQIAYDASLGCVTISDGSETVLVFSTNIAYAVPAAVEPVKSSQKK